MSIFFQALWVAGIPSTMASRNFPSKSFISGKRQSSRVWVTLSHNKHRSSWVFGKQGQLESNGRMVFVNLRVLLFTDNCRVRSWTCSTLYFSVLRNIKLYPVPSVYSCFRAVGHNRSKWISALHRCTDHRAFKWCSVQVREWIHAPSPYG